MTLLDALRAAVDVEDQAAYGFGLAGARLSGAERARAASAVARHRARRDQLSALLVQQGATPPVAAPAYAPPFPVRDAVSARQLCAALEDAAAGAAWDLVAASAAGAPARALGVGWLTEAAVAAAGWRGAGAAEPALPGRRS